MAKATRSAAKRPADENKKVTLDELIQGALENLEFQMKQTHFKNVSRNAHAIAARGSIKHTVNMGEGPALHKYLTAELEIDDRPEVAPKKK